MTQYDNYIDNTLMFWLLLGSAHPNQGHLSFIFQFHYVRHGEQRACSKFSHLIDSGDFTHSAVKLLMDPRSPQAAYGAGAVGVWRARVLGELCVLGEDNVRQGCTYSLQEIGARFLLVLGCSSRSSSLSSKGGAFQPGTGMTFSPVSNKGEKFA